MTTVIVRLKHMPWIGISLVSPSLTQLLSFREVVVYECSGCFRGFVSINFPMHSAVYCETIERRSRHLLDSHTLRITSSLVSPHNKRWGQLRIRITFQHPGALLVTFFISHFVSRTFFVLVLPYKISYAHWGEEFCFILYYFLRHHAVLR